MTKPAQPPVQAMNHTASRPFGRLLRHLCMPRWRMRRAFPPAALAAIERAIQSSESLHGGELRFAVETTLPLPALWRGASARDRAIELFSSLRMWDTDERNGVLIYLLLAEHSVEIVADRGVHARAGTPQWEDVCRHMQQAFGRGQFESGAIEGVRAVAATLARHYPQRANRRNELPDKVVVL